MLTEVPKTAPRKHPGLGNPSSCYRLSAGLHLEQLALQ